MNNLTELLKKHMPTFGELKKRAKQKGAEADLEMRRTQDVPGWHERDAVIKKFRVFIQAGLNNLVTGIKPTIEQAMKATATDPATIKSAAYLAVAQNIKMDTSKLDAALKSLHEAAIAAGLDVAAKQVSIEPIQGGRAVTDLLNQRGITLRQLTQTTLDRINTAVANGVANGHDYKTLSQSIYQAINGQSPETIPTPAMAPGSYGTDVAVQTRADIIAMTETVVRTTPQPLTPTASPVPRAGTGLPTATHVSGAWPKRRRTHTRSTTTFHQSTRTANVAWRLSGITLKRAMRYHKT